MTKPSRIEILGVPIDALKRNETLALLESYIQSGRPHQIATVNPEFIVEATENPAFKNLLRQTDLNLADGSGVLWASRLLGRPLPARLPGADLAQALLKRAAQQNWRVYFVGGGPGIAAAAARAMTKHYPGLQIVEAHEGIVSDSTKTEAKMLAHRIGKLRPDILFVAFGSPKQDQFIADHKSILNGSVMMGVGGTFDFWADKVRRAPWLLRVLGVEFLWRLILEPWRIRRVWRATIVFISKLLAYKKTSG